MIRLERRLGSGLRCRVRIGRKWRRLHHGHLGFWATVLGVAAMIHDRRDFPWIWDNW